MYSGWLTDNIDVKLCIEKNVSLLSFSMKLLPSIVYCQLYNKKINLKYAISIQRKNFSVWLVRYMYVPFTYLGDTEFEQLDTRLSAVRWNNLKFAHWLIKNSNPLPYVWSMDNSLFL